MLDPDFILPASLKVIDEEAFAGAAMTVVLCPEGLEEICADAFKGCSQLKEIYIPDSVEFIDGGAFDGCASDLTIFGYNNTVAQVFARINNIAFVEVTD